MTHRPDRRRFLASAAALGLVSTAAPPARAATHRGLPPDVRRVLFQGDSITDAFRDRERQSTPSDPPALGEGYAFLTAAGMLCAHPEDDFEFLNRGVSGDRVPDLAARWEADTLALEPDLLSILIGVNDHWRTVTAGSTATVEDYERAYDALLARTRERLPRVRLVVCEPFALRVGEVTDAWYPAFDAYRAAAARLADAHGATFVPFQAALDRACTLAPPAHWAADGVHPTDAGAALLAQTWLRTVLEAGAR